MVCLIRRHRLLPDFVRIPRAPSRTRAELPYLFDICNTLDYGGVLDLFGGALLAAAWSSLAVVMMCVGVLGARITLRVHAASI